MADMTAIVFAEPGAADVLHVAEVPRPEPGPGDVLLAVAAAGVNQPDILQRQGRYPAPKDASPVLGLEVSGRVIACGPGARRWAVGDLVCALVNGGGYAQYVTVPEGQCLPIPANVSLMDAAGLPETYFTVWSTLFERAYADAGESVLVHGGSSGIGVTAIQLAKAFDMTVFVTAGTAAKCAACLQLGADAAINYREQDFVAAIHGLTNGRGVDIVLDMVGGDYVPRNIACLAENGRHVSIGVQNGVQATVNMFDLMRRRLTLTGATLRPRSTLFKAAIASSLETDVWPLFAEGRLRAVTDRVFPLAQAADAHRHLEGHSHVGKVLLAVNAEV